MTMNREALFRWLNAVDEVAIREAHQPHKEWVRRELRHLATAVRDVRHALLAEERPEKPDTCLACAREECAAAGFPGIDRIQEGHSCGTPPPIYTLSEGGCRPGNVDLEELIRANGGPDGSLSEEQVAEIRRLGPGESLTLGGGAGETFTLRRLR